MKIQALLKVLLLAGCLAAAWLVLRQVDWVGIFETERRKDELEKGLGDLYWEFFKETEGEWQDSTAMEALDKVVTRICKANGIDRGRIKVHILNSSECNAFALPDHHLVVFRGLLECSEGPDELAGVLGHEIAHMEKNHIMKKLIKEFGLSALASIISGGGGEILKESARTLTSSAYDRKLEQEADLVSVDYLIEAGIDPTPFSDFLHRLGEQTDIPEEFYWISTHDESGVRARAILDRIHTKAHEGGFSPSLSQEEWAAVQRKVAQPGQLFQ